MSPDIVHDILLQISGPDAAERAEVEVVWEDQHVLSLRWRLEKESGSAKVLKLEGGGWKLLSREI